MTMNGECTPPEDFRFAPTTKAVHVPLPEVFLGVDDTLSVGDEGDAAGESPIDNPGDELSTWDIGIEDAVVVEADEVDDTTTETEPTGPTKIAGVTLSHVSDGLPHHPEGAKRDYQESLAYRITKAKEIAKDNPSGEGILRGPWDPRMPYVEVYGGARGEATDYNVPTYHFYLNDGLLENLQAAAAEKGNELTINEQLAVGLAETEGAVDPNFSSDALNAINASYYASDVAFSNETGPATMFAANRPINQALGTLMARECGTPDTLKVKELCSGGRTAHWAQEAMGALQAGVEHVEVTLTDFVEPTVEPEAAMVNGATIHTEQYSLFDDMPTLPEGERYNAMVETYNDSVWEEGDMHITRAGGQTYQTVFRVKVADWNERKDELIAAMRAGEPLSDAEAKDYDGIFVERAKEPIDLNNHPYREYIENRPGNSIMVPGGLIKRVVEAFDKQLNQNGVFVSADVGNFGFAPPGKTPSSPDAISGVAARYHCDDYVLAKQILEGEYGFEVRLLSLEDLANENLPHLWQVYALGREIDSITGTPSNGVMLVKRRQTAA
jgi:hypothetical protein